MYDRKSFYIENARRINRHGLLLPTDLVIGERLVVPDIETKRLIEVRFDEWNTNRNMVICSRVRRGKRYGAAYTTWDRVPKVKDLEDFEL